MIENTPNNQANLSADQKRALLARLLREKAQVRESYVAISHNQKALWFLSHLAPESSAYNLLYSARIAAQIDVPALQRAISKIAQRYPQLTSTYVTQNGAPKQKLVQNGSIPFELISAPNWSEEGIRHYLIEESNRPISIEQGPMLRVLLFERSTDDYVFALIAHHIAVDMWALDIVVDELSVLYVAEKTGLSAPLMPVGPQHSEYVRWQNELLAGPEGERHWQYWRDTLKGELPVLNLPLDAPRPTKQTYRGASQHFSIDAQVTRQLRKLAQGERVTLFTVMIAAYYTLLYRLSNQQDIIVATPALGRTRSEWEHVIDYLANPVMTRGQFDSEITFKDLLTQMRQQVLGALEHQDFPFPLIVERLQPRRDPSYSAIYQTLFIWDRPARHNLSDLVRGAQAGMYDEFMQRVNQESLTFEPFVYGQQGAQLDLALTVFEIEGELTGEFRYNTDLFNAATIERFAESFQVILAGIVANPDEKLLELPVLTEKERQMMLIDWNSTEAYYPQKCLHQLIEEQAARVPERLALRFEDRSYSYRELNEAANGLAHRLRSMGVGADVLVGVCMERSLEMVVALLAVLKAGGAYVPLDPSYPEERLAYMVQDADVSVLLTQARFVEQVPTIERTICLDPGWNADWQESIENLDSGVRPDNLAYMIYTSGSTGKPKGVMNTHQGIVNRLYWMQQQYGLGEQDRVMQKTPFSFDVSVWEFFWPLLAGSTLVVARPGGHQNPGYLADLIAQQGITTLHFVPSMLQAFLQEPRLAERCSSLKRVICSGEALARELQDRFFAVFPQGVQLHNLYGPTEAAVDVTYWQCQADDAAVTVPIGRPIANTQLYIVNEALQPTPIGVAGELLIGGVGLARGYHRRPELTAEKFIRDPFSTDEHARVFRTADLARYRVDGVIEFLGRIDHQVKIRGFRIELGEIEAALSAHPAIKEVVVTAREDTPGNKRLVAYLVARTPAEQPSIEALRGFLKTTLPDYMIPAVFMFMEAFPLSPNGKINRNVLPVPDSERPQLQATFVAPRTALEQQLAEIWSRILDIDRIGVHDNYFDLGGASIQGLEIIAQANAAEIPLKTEMLFEFQTIAELAAAVERHAPSQEPAIEQALQAQAVEDIAAMPSTESEQEHLDASLVDALPSPIDELPTTFKNTLIESLGTYLPPKVVTSAEVLQDCRVPIQFPLDKLTGVRSRRMAGETEFSFDIARQAVEDCFRNSRYRPEDIDMIVCGNISRCNGPDFQFTFEPNTAIQLKQYFGMKNAIAFDVSNACTGLFTAINITDSFLKTGTIRRGLVVSGEYISHLILTAQKEIESYMDSRLACLTVGDAGAALILESSADQKVGFHEFEMYTVSRYSEACIGKATPREHGGAIMYTDAVTVSAVNMKQAVAHAGMVLERAQWPKNSFQHVVVHQTSKTTIKDAAREINRYFGEEVCDPDSVIYNIEERGNTATTTHMVAVMDFIRNGRIKTGDNAIFGITGSGATIGTAIYTFDDLPDRIRQREAGSYTPQKVVEADGFIPRLPSNHRVQVESTGIVPANLKVAKNSLDLLEVAALNCLADSSYSKSDIDLLVYTGVYRDEFISEPAIAALLAGKLEMNDEIETQQDKKTFALDLFNSGLGTLDACYAAIGMLHARKIKNALIIASEVENNRQLQVPGRVGVEETGSAMILGESPDGKTGFGQFMFKHFPEYAGASSVHTVVRNGKMILDIEQDPQLEQYYLRCIQETVREFLQREELDMAQVKVILPPQISSTFNTELAAKLHVEGNKLVTVSSEHDLFTSSLPYTLHHIREHRLAKAGDIGLIVSVGTGIQVGCATYYF